MAGVKGKSGRKARIREVDINVLMDKCTRWLVDNFDSFEQKDKMRVALEISKKIVPQKMDHNVSMKLDITEILKNANRRSAVYQDGGRMEEIANN